MPEYIELEKTKDVARITLNRPKHNVMNIDMIIELNSLLKQLLEDKELKCVIFSGKGPSWCAGVEVGDHKPEKVEDMIKNFGQIFELIEEFDVPIIAAVHGACLGGGMELAIACDTVIASEKAKFGQPEIKLGFFPPYAAARLPEIVGPAKAVEICTTGRIYTAKEAESIGFISHTVSDENFETWVEDFVKEIKKLSPLIIRLNKRIVKQSSGLKTADALQIANDYFLNTLMKTQDTLEGIKSFEEKRKPNWKNI